MRVLLSREPSTRAATIGPLAVDGEQGRRCFTLEDVVRERPGIEVAAWKIAGKTAIPSGVYQIGVTYSQRFGGALPLLLGVPGFEGVWIHSGNTAADTEGCILVGLHRSIDVVQESRAAFELVYGRVQSALSAGEEVWIEIRNETGPATDQVLA